MCLSFLLFLSLSLSIFLFLSLSFFFSFPLAYFPFLSLLLFSPLYPISNETHPHTFLFPYLLSCSLSYPHSFLEQVDTNALISTKSFFHGNLSLKENDGINENCSSFALRKIIGFRRKFYHLRCNFYKKKGKKKNSN